MPRRGRRQRVGITIDSDDTRDSRGEERGGVAAAAQGAIEHQLGAREQLHHRTHQRRCMIFAIPVPALMEVARASSHLITSARAPKPARLPAHTLVA